MTMFADEQRVATDNEGFLLDPADWDRDVAEVLAGDLGLELTPERWEIVQFIRDYYETHHAVPEARMLLKELREKYGKERATRKYIYNLFPYGYGQQACKIAGMRKPLKLMLDI